MANFRSRTPIQTMIWRLFLRFVWFLFTTSRRNRKIVIYSILLLVVLVSVFLLSHLIVPILLIALAYFYFKSLRRKTPANTGITIEHRK